MGDWIDDFDNYVTRGFERLKNTPNKLATSLIVDEAYANFADNLDFLFLEKYSYIANPMLVWLGCNFEYDVPSAVGRIYCRLEYRENEDRNSARVPILAFDFDMDRTKLNVDYVKKVFRQIDGKINEKLRDIFGKWVVWMAEYYKSLGTRYDKLLFLCEYGLPENHKNEAMKQFYAEIPCETIDLD